MTSNDRLRVRRDSMLGTALLLIGVAALIAYPFFGELWILVLGLALCGVAVVFLYRAGRKLP
jgi:hypothetical protein